MAKTWLITPTARAHSEYAPLGMAFLASFLRGRGHEVVWDLVGLEGIDGAALARRARQLAPDAAFVSSAPRFYCTCPVPTVEAALVCARSARDGSSGTRLVAIGPVASVRPDVFLVAGGFDAVCRGEPEASAEGVLLAPSVEACGAVPGASVALRAGPEAPYVDLASLPPPARDLLPMESFVFESHFARRTTAIQASRGCPFACAFCFINRDDAYANLNAGKKFRTRTPEQIVAEVSDLKARYGIDGLFFEDSEFVVHRRHAEGVAEALARSHLDVRWSAHIRATSVDREMLALLHRAGCREIFFGVESGNSALLASTGKGVTLESIEEAFRLTREAGIRTTASLVLGLPGETPATVEETVRFARRLKPDHASFHIYAPYAGTRWHDDAVAAGRLEPDAFDRTRPHANLRAYRTEAMTAEDLDAARRRAYRSFYRDPRYLARRLMHSSRREIFFYARTLLGLRRDIRTAEASVREAILGASSEKLAR